MPTLTFSPTLSPALARTADCHFAQATIESEMGDGIDMDDPNFWAKMLPGDGDAVKADAVDAAARASGADRIKGLKLADFDEPQSLQARPSPNPTRTPNPVPTPTPNPDPDPNPYPYPSPLTPNPNPNPDLPP